MRAAAGRVHPVGSLKSTLSYAHLPASVCPWLFVELIRNRIKTYMKGKGGEPDVSHLPCSRWGRQEGSPQGRWVAWMCSGRVSDSEEEWELLVASDTTGHGWWGTTRLLGWESTVWPGKVQQNENRWRIAHGLILKLKKKNASSEAKTRWRLRSRDNASAPHLYQGEAEAWFSCVYRLTEAAKGWTVAGSRQQYSSGTTNIRKGVEQGQTVCWVVQMLGAFVSVKEDAGGATFLGLIAISR